MIEGHATATGTQERASRFDGLRFNPLGRTGLMVSAAGFGCYRVDAGVPAHAHALEAALAGGINLIDTSANYADGGSERLVGNVLTALCTTGKIRREEVVVISKGGYLQGENYALSQQRKADSQPFPELVEYADGLEHCIHPDFLSDQIQRSLARLSLGTIDGYLLHNPEYYLTWAMAQGMELAAARREYERRIGNAFRYLETEVTAGRIRFYGISSNTFPVPADEAGFTSLARVWHIAQSLGKDHHFGAIQLPFNLFESGAVLERNQPDGQSVLELATAHRLGVVTNRPLNAMAGNRLVRLSDVEVRSRMEYREIIQRIKTLAQSESRLWRKILPGMTQIPDGLKVRIKQQGCVAEVLKHHWRSFGSLERWRQTRDAVFMPRIQGVFDFLAIHAENEPSLAGWLDAHRKTLERAFRAVASIYADDAVTREKTMHQAISSADPAWSRSGTLSQRAVGALATTTGISSVLVGMRRETYVKDILGAMDTGAAPADRTAAWGRLQQSLAGAV